VSAQQLDVKKSWRAIRRHRLIVAAVAAVGLLGGIAYGLVVPAMHTATSLVVLPPPPATDTEKSAAAGPQSIDTQVFIAESEPVLKSAGQNLDPTLTTEQVRGRVKVTAVTQDVIKIDAKGQTARQSMQLANAVAGIYLVYVTSNQNLPGDLGKKTGARVLEQATSARGGNVLVHLGILGLLGALIGAAAGSVGVLAKARGDRRLRLRDEIADAVGLPVLASVSSYQATNVSDWAYLLEHYSPTAVEAWSLRKTLHHLGLDVRGGPPVTLTVLSFAGDDNALPLGPQLAALATSIGLSASIVVDTHQEPAGSPALTIHLVVVDRDAPHLDGSERTTNTIIALSSGVVTAEELARLAVAAAASDRDIDGLVVTDPDPTDRTIGRVSQSARRSNSRLPTLLTGTARRTK
jgi:capsular polysaccharide biosynthesis protein